MLSFFMDKIYAILYIIIGITSLFFALQVYTFLFPSHEKETVESPSESIKEVSWGKLQKLPPSSFYFSPHPSLPFRVLLSLPAPLSGQKSFIWKSKSKFDWISLFGQKVWVTNKNNNFYISPGRTEHQQGELEVKISAQDVNWVVRYFMKSAEKSKGNLPPDTLSIRMVVRGMFFNALTASFATKLGEDHGVTSSMKMPEKMEFHLKGSRRPTLCARGPAKNLHSWMSQWKTGMISQTVARLARPSPQSLRRFLTAASHFPNTTVAIENHALYMFGNKKIIQKALYNMYSIGEKFGTHLVVTDNFDI